MVVLKKVVEFKAWQFFVSAVDADNILHGNLDYSKQSDLEQSLPNLSIRKMVITEVEPTSRYSNTPRFMAVVYQRGFNYHDSEIEHVLYEGDWLVEYIGVAGGHKVLTNGQLSTITY